MKSIESFSDNVLDLKQAIESADAVIIGAGAGLSTAAGMYYSGERFEHYFADFREKYGIQDMYSGGFYPFKTLNEYWAWWSWNIWANRYEPGATQVYKDLFEVVKDKDYFVLTTNVDHQFQLAGFDKQRLFYTQGDYGLIQCSKPCHQKNYDNEEIVRQMIDQQHDMKVPSELIPHCPKCGAPMVPNLRIDDSFVEDEGWHAAKDRFASFLSHHGESGSFGFVKVEKPTRGEENQNILYLELGIGGNTPGIIKYPFWQAVHKNPNAIYANINYGQAGAPREIASRSICLNSDIGEVLREIK